ncbi:MAG TPA: hypothetical protein VFZ47_08295, partial [Chitinophagaceae bacterium]
MPASLLTKRFKGLLISGLLLLPGEILYCQIKPNFIDGRQHNYCKSCITVLDEMPKEVLFGLHLNDDGSIYFSMNDRQWFEKIFNHDSYGVAVDIISKDRYNCSKNIDNQPGIPKGHILPGVYKNDLIRNSKDLMPGSIYTKIGNIPPSLMGKELEGNLVILNGAYICYYTNFVDIDRSAWHLLPMGLFVDS